jgi:hypothetical protein
MALRRLEKCTELVQRCVVPAPYTARAMSDPETAPHPHPLTVRLARIAITISIVGVLIASGWAAVNYFKVGGQSATVSGTMIGGASINNGTINNSYQFPEQKNPEAMPKSATSAPPPTSQNRIGRVSWLNLSNSLKDSKSDIKQQGTKNFVVISSSAENRQVAEDLRAMLESTHQQSNLVPLGLPDYERNADAPRFEAGNSAHIDIHGEGAAAEFLDTVLNHCYFARRKKAMPEGVAEYFHGRYPTTISLDDKFLWLEIGDGQLLRPNTCQDTPGN